MIRRRRWIDPSEPLRSVVDAPEYWQNAGMDPFTLTFYAIVCGILSAIAPNLGGIAPRLITGAVVGVVAAAALPFLRGMIGA
ncbi:MAG: hypothetical protein OXQ92_04310 [Boseongicola sp.]|nr:hypothetical protein [Boseongicola sp.]